MARYPPIPVPRQWPSCIKSAFIHTISLSSAVFTSTCALASRRKSEIARLKAELAQAYQEIALLEEELTLKNERFCKIPAHKRPRYSPIQRLRILLLRAARRWSIAQTARAFLLNQRTIIDWTRRLDEGGEYALLQMAEPVNKFPEFVRAIVRQLKAFFPGMGKVKIAQILARAGLHLGVTTIKRMLKEKPTVDVDAEFPFPDEEPVKTRIVTAKYPDHVWHIDLSAVPTSTGYCVSWNPFSIPQSWPFCYWVAVVLDHYSRKVMGFAVFLKKPTSEEVRVFLGRAIRKAGKAPKYIISDKEKIFFCPAYKNWCKRNNIRPRFGAVNKHGSIAVIERFFRTMKNECTRKIKVPLNRDAFRRELVFYMAWYNQYRPHTYLKGKTPDEVYVGLVPANKKPRIEPRTKYPRRSPCASPQASIRGRPGTKFVLTVTYMENRKHLPVIELKKVA